jgi:hypothetical protein
LFVRQRLSSEPDRYRGRRRVPTPPRSRYAIVVTSAFVGAGVVALGAASQIPDHKAISPEVLKNLESAHVASDAIANRSTDDHAASRGEDRSATVDKTKLSANDAAADVWMLPMEEFTFTSPYGVRFGVLHAGIDLADPQGTPFKAVHTGQVTQAGYNGGYGYCITVRNTDGTEVIYAHARRLFVKAAPRDPRSRSADRPDPLPAAAGRGHQARRRVGLREHGGRRFLIRRPGLQLGWQDPFLLRHRQARADWQLSVVSA